ncbi:MAG: B12-binding domain-containing radical SAM protein [Sandaracinaceae bacterium]|nr:B12-binding domain-containing radical SAM protein [Sandaracinaceae bacterium]
MDERSGVPRKKRLLLLSPRDFATTYGDLRHVSHLTGDTGRLLNVALPTLAALVPRSELEVDIVDENALDLDPRARWDIVGITGFPPQLFRARELAARFRQQGSLVVCGGTSVSLSPERWQGVADVLVLGEAERVWPKLLRDYLDGRIDRSAPQTYQEHERLDLSLTPIPDYAPYGAAQLARFGGGIVQTSRGCPFECEFCDAIVFAGRKIRYKPIDTILAELEQLERLGMRYAYLADDNFGAGRKKAKEILRALRDFNRRRARPMPLLTQLTIDLAADEEFLELSAEAGLTRVFVGLETPSLESLRETRKLQNVRHDMREGVRRFQAHGIEVLGGSVVGFDHDGLDIFRRQLDFFTELGIPSVQVYPLNAPDGTPLKERMIREGRYLDWETSSAARTQHFSYFSSFTIEPAQMSQDQLRQGIHWLLWRLYDWDAFPERLRVFFETYEEGSSDRKLAIPTRIDRLTPRALVHALANNRDSLMLLARLLRHLATDAEPAERRAFFRLIRHAARSSHPQRWSLAVSAFLTLVNTRRMLLEQVPGIAEATYPSAREPPPRPPPDVPLHRILRPA